MTQSRQIQLFGLTGVVVMVLFIIIFLGRDFYNLYQHIITKTRLPQLKDDQIVMESQAISQLKEMLDDESSMMMANYQEGSSSTGHKALDDSKSDDNEITLKEYNMTHHVSKVVQTDPMPISSSDQIRQEKRTTQPDTQDIMIKKLNREIHTLLQQVSYQQVGGIDSKEFQAILAAIVQKLKKVSGSYTVEVEGHTAAGIPQYMSQNMAKQSAEYLKKLLPDTPVTTVGYADEYPICDDPEDTTNTRIEIIVRRNE